VAAPFFNKWMTPVGFILLFLTGVGPLLAWRRSTVSNLQRQFIWPVLTALVVGGGVVALGVPLWASGICFALCGFVTGTISQEFIRGAFVRRTSTGTDAFTALVGLFSRSRRRYGGYIVHLGIVLIFLGFAGEGLNSKRKEEASLTPGQQVEIGPYLVQYRALSVTSDTRKQMITAEVAVTRNGAPLGSMYPARWFFAGRESEPTTEVALRRGFASDLYIVLAGYAVETQTATLQITVNPLVNWIWFGVGIMIVGTLIALLPERAFAFATSRVPSGAVPTSLVLVAALGIGSARLLAQHVEASQSVMVIPKTPIEKDLRGHIVCTCGGCGRQRISDCTCPVADRMRAELAKQASEGKDREAIIQWFVSHYGSQEVLAEPIDKGFNPLAWLLPYGIGVIGIVLVGGVAVRWSHRRSEAAAGAASPVVNPELEGRLDDELRELD